MTATALQTPSGPGVLRDPRLPGIEHLTGPGAAPMIEAIAATLGARVGGFEIAQISHTPSSSCTVSYAGSLEWSDGTRTTETLVAVTAVDGPPPGASVLAAQPPAGDESPFQVGVWRYPFDPALPGLAHTVIPELADERYGDLVGTPVVPTVVGYRPGRRAVVRLDGPAGTVWAKVLRPTKADRLAELHDRAVAAGVVVPVVRRRSDDGVVVLSHLDGTTLRDRLLSGAPGLPPSALAPVLDRLGDLDLGHRARRNPLGDVDAHLESLVATLPDQELRLRRLVAALDTDRRGEAEAIGADVVVHGDLHDAQVVLHGGARGVVPALLDLDDMGRGDRADDVANLIAHVGTLATTLEPGRARRLRSWCAEVDGLVAALGLDAAEVARRAAAAALSLATGPLRACEPDWRRSTLDRIALAERLAGSVDASARENSLRGASRRTHPHAGEQTASTDVTLASHTGGTP